MLPHSMSQAARMDCMAALCEIVATTGKHILQMEPERISDTHQVSGHQFSTLDEYGKMLLRQECEKHLGDECLAFMEESDIQLGVSDSSRGYPVAIGDAVEGSTNAKRGLSSAIGRHSHRPILAGTSLMVLEGKKLATIVATAFFDWSSSDTISSVRTDPGSFLAFVNNQGVFPKEAMASPRDSQQYAIVPGYSHSNVRNRAEAEEKLLGAGIRTDGGSRSSAQDMLQVLWGQADAYVDLRQLFSQGSANRDEVLRAWDVGALLPVLDALGFIITNEHEQSWQDKGFGDALTLVVARNPELWKMIHQAIGDLSFVRASSSDAPTSIPIHFAG